MLPGLLADTRAINFDGAGHMGPLTHAEAVAVDISRHIRCADETAHARTQTGSMSEWPFERHVAAACSANVLVIEEEAERRA
jgi:hypothetical protein